MYGSFMDAYRLHSESSSYCSAKGKELCTDADPLLESHTRACLSLSILTGTIGTGCWCEATGAPYKVTVGDTVNVSTKTSRSLVTEPLQQRCI